MKSKRQCSKFSFGSSSKQDENTAIDWFWFVVFLGGFRFSFEVLLDRHTQKPAKRDRPAASSELRFEPESQR